MSVIEERARALRAVIENLAEDHLDDTEALENTELFPNWAEDVAYEMGVRVRYDGVLYKCVQNHTSRSDWNPADAISLWTVVLNPDPEIIPDWVQPISTNPYMKDDKVRHIGKIWISLIDYNTYEPGSVGTEYIWSEVV